MNLLVTGAYGFVGGAILRRAAESSVKQLFGLVRLGSQELPLNVSRIVVGDLSQRTKWPDCLRSVDTVVHAAGRAHILRDRANNPLEEFRRVNRDTTLRLAEACAASNVRRFIFISSIGVNGSRTFGTPFRADDVPRPATPYAISKMEAEEGLWRIAAKTGLEVVVIRPPLVYGAGAPGNFRRLLWWVKTGIPMPLAAVANKRSLVGIDNLVDLIMTTLDHPAAAGQVLLVSDDFELSTTDLLRLIGRVLDVPVRLFPVSSSVLRVISRVVGKEEMAAQLLDSLEADIAKTKALLGWRPKMRVMDGLRKINLKDMHNSQFSSNS